MQAADAHIAAIRSDYRLAALDEEMVGDDPVYFFQQWFAAAEAAAVTEVNAMTLATADTLGQPHARIVLLKGVDDRGFVFYTNYDSDKGRQMAARPHVSLLFFWKELERQVRIEGIIQKVTDAESDAYFDSRPEGSKIGAWASPQSNVIDSRSVLEDAANTFKKIFSNGEIRRPENWGGYRVIPERIEFWQGRSSRLHDRILFIKNGAGWEKLRLAP